MQTFLPYANFAASAKVLDRQRLGKQRVEAKQILTALTNPSYGWQNHPAVKMWRGHEAALCQYGLAICQEWKARGYKDTCEAFFLTHSPGAEYFHTPSWLTEEFCLAHRSNLVRKLPSHYRQWWSDVPDDLPYIWPV
jgi:hypothetical protein